MPKIIIYLFIFSFVLYQSCRSSFDSNERDEKLTIKLSTPNKELYDSCVIFKLLEVDNYEVHIPLISISKFVVFRNENILGLYINYIKDILSSFDKGVFEGKFFLGNYFEYRIDSEYLMSNEFKFLIEDSKLFESGEYYIYNNKTKEYLNEVNIRIKSSYSGPLSASYSYEVFVRNILIYGIYMNS